MVFCIDVRSEPLRSAIESMGAYETFGFAGFFGLPIRMTGYDNESLSDSCPVLLKPAFHVSEKAIAANAHHEAHYKKGKALKKRLNKIYQQLKYNISTPFTLVESLGIYCGMSMLMKSCAPKLTARIHKALNDIICPSIQTEPVFESDAASSEGITLQDQIRYAEMALRLMGLTSNFAKLVMFCGHGSTTENNPYAAALDCGACGGNKGGKNAQLLAAILNKAVVRESLASKGISIPPDTVFCGAQHDTTTDDVVIYDAHIKQVNHEAILEQLKQDLKQVKHKNNEERSRHLSLINKVNKDIARRSMDWSETRAEWGLARNAAFIIAPRQLTKNIKLDSRCFLHSYEWHQDAEGKLLENILTAPMIVAHWINMQYLFSSLDNAAYGSGSKITHNMVGKIGMMQGNGSDLMHGLPLQSVMSADNIPFHEPQRLLGIVYGVRETVSQLIEQNSLLKTLFFNSWIHLIVIDPQNKHCYQLETDNTWTLIPSTAH